MHLSLNSRLARKFGRYVPFLKIGPAEIDREAVLRLRPLRHAALTWEWDKTNKGETILTITIPENPNVGRITKWIARRWNVPTAHHKVLDEVGGTVWELCDGSRTVESIVRQAGKKYRMNRREAEVSVTMFLQMLHDRNLIGFYTKGRKPSAQAHGKDAERGNPTP